MMQQYLGGLVVYQHSLARKNTFRVSVHELTLARFFGLGWTLTRADSYDTLECSARIARIGFSFTFYQYQEMP